MINIIEMKEEVTTFEEQAHKRNAYTIALPIPVEPDLLVFQYRE